MKFGLFTIVPWHESRTQEQSLREALEQIELADQLGLDEVWLGEHRFSRYTYRSGPVPDAHLAVAITHNRMFRTSTPEENPLVPIGQAIRKALGVSG